MMRNQIEKRSQEQRLEEFAELLLTHEFDAAEAEHALAMGAPIYYIEEDTPENLLIKEYPSGRKELIIMKDTGEEVVQKIICQ